MKKLLFALALLAGVSHETKAQFFPKECITNRDTTTTFKRLYRAPLFDIKVQRANISAVTVPVSIGEATIQNGNVTLGNSLTIGGALIAGAANVQLLKDSTVFASGLTYYGLAVAYGISGISGNKDALIFGGIVGYEDFAVMLGTDVLSWSQPYPAFRLALSYNLTGLPFLANKAKITLK